MPSQEKHDDEEHDDDECDDGEQLHPERRGRALDLVVSVSDGILRGSGIGHRSATSLQDTMSLRCHIVLAASPRMLRLVPKLWNQTIQAHRHQVRGAIMDTTAGLVAEHGLRAVTMSQIATDTGIGRATLYKYFPSVEAILVAWHERQIAAHLEDLAELRSQPGDPGEQLEAVLHAYALIQHEHHGTQLAALLHRGEHVARAQQQLSDLIRDLLRVGAETGDFRDDVAPDELASYCLHAIAAAPSLQSKAAVRRLVEVTLAGLRPTGSRLTDPTQAGSVRATLV